MQTYFNPVKTNGIKFGILNIGCILTVKSLLTDNINLVKFIQTKNH